MHIAGLQKTSLIDYPGLVSCVAFFTGCNFACPYCHNPDLACGRWPQRIGRKELLSFLQQRRGLLDGVVFSGGEATLAQGLPDLCRAVRALGFSVKLDTNGSRPTVLKKLIDAGLVDFIAMDIKTTPQGYRAPLCFADSGADISESIELIMKSGVDYEFRSTCVKPFIDDSLVVQIARLISGARQYTLQTFRPDPVLSPEFFANLDAGFTPDQMRRLQAAAACWVKRCSIR